MRSVLACFSREEEAQAGGEELVVDGETEALRALFHRTRRSLLWRLANQNLFHALAEALFFELHESWPGGELNISNVKGEDGEGGKFELWLPEFELWPPKFELWLPKFGVWPPEFELRRPKFEL